LPEALTAGDFPDYHSLNNDKTCLSYLTDIPHRVVSSFY
jgi:hypothetical protein